MRFKNIAIHHPTVYLITQRSSHRVIKHLKNNMDTFTMETAGELEIAVD